MPLKISCNVCRLQVDETFWPFKRRVSPFVSTNFMGVGWGTHRQCILCVNVFFLLWRRANARNVSQHTLYGVQHIHINLTLIHCTFYRHTDADQNQFSRGLTSIPLYSVCSQQSRCPITGRLFVSYFRCILLQMKISNWTVLCSTGLNTSRRSSNWARTGLAIAEIWPWTKWRESGFAFRLCDKTNSLESTTQNTFRVHCRGGSINHVRLYESNAFASLWRDMELLWKKRETKDTKLTSSFQFIEDFYQSVKRRYRGRLVSAYLDFF